MNNFTQQWEKNDTIKSGRRQKHSTLNNEIGCKRRNKFGLTWGWVNRDRIVIFRWNISLVYNRCDRYSSQETSQVTYVTMVPRMGNETLRPLGVATGNALSVTRVWRYICKNTTCWPATAHDVTTGVPQYKCRRENTSSASSSEACVRSMAQSLGDAVSRCPFGEPWLHT